MESGLPGAASRIDHRLVIFNPRCTHQYISLQRVGLTSDGAYEMILPTSIGVSDLRGSWITRCRLGQIDVSPSISITHLDLGNSYSMSGRRVPEVSSSRGQKEYKYYLGKGVHHPHTRSLPVFGVISTFGVDVVASMQ
ncbi:hypothetical protein PTI98_000483 [Pleurotus ostreatus]|nr:hypothetical protein PTI98_000483 [Pleurotus ostreatus]